MGVDNYAKEDGEGMMKYKVTRTMNQLGRLLLKFDGAEVSAHISLVEYLNRARQIISLLEELGYKPPKDQNQFPEVSNSGGK